MHMSSLSSLHTLECSGRRLEVARSTCRRFSSRALLYG